jgi:hypothetical protein
MSLACELRNRDDRARDGRMVDVPAVALVGSLETTVVPVDVAMRWV